ncbi:MAG: inositol monophosphatase [Candidatus Omnitrophota bacterium]|nr:MAG: inositol monophosphatase [Candidatus Omnitrophota bacterium]
MKDIITTGVNAAVSAGKFLLENFGKIDKIDSKGDRNLVTNLDRAAEQIIIDGIRTKFPDHAILGEEGGKIGGDKEYLWIIDPLDGTHNFIRGIDIFGVSIGIVYKDDFVGGIIYMPPEAELYVGEKGNGSYKNGSKIAVSKHGNLKECSISFDSSIRYSPDIMLKVLDILARESFNIRMFGSSVRVLTYIAEGKLDFAVEFHDRPWDFSGGVCIIEEAGGRLSDLKGGRLTYKAIGYIASNGIIHQKVEEIISSCF